jgi:hypothetical protein
MSILWGGERGGFVRFGQAYAGCIMLSMHSRALRYRDSPLRSDSIVFIKVALIRRGAYTQRGEPMAQTERTVYSSKKIADRVARARNNGWKELNLIDCTVQDDDL